MQCLIGCLPCGAAVQKPRSLQPANANEPLNESEDSIVGSWYYPTSFSEESHYEVSTENGVLVFHQVFTDGRKVCGELVPEGEWLVCTLTFADGREQGKIRVRRQDDTVISNYKRPGSDVWEYDITAGPKDVATPAGGNGSIPGSPTRGGIVGRWCYPVSFTGETHYSISNQNGELIFRQHLRDGGTVSGKLRREGEWLLGSVKYPDGADQGVMRLRRKGDTLVSNFRSPDCASWEHNITALRSDCSATSSASPSRSASKNDTATNAEAFFAASGQSSASQATPALVQGLSAEAAEATRIKTLRAAAVLESGFLMHAEKEQGCLQTLLDNLVHRWSESEPKLLESEKEEHGRRFAEERACLLMLVDNLEQRLSQVRSSKELVAELQWLSQQHALMLTSIELLQCRLENVEGNTGTVVNSPSELSICNALRLQMMRVQEVSAGLPDAACKACMLQNVPAALETPEEALAAARERSSPGQLSSSYCSSGSYFPSPETGSSPLGNRHHASQSRPAGTGGPPLGIKRLQFPLAGGSPEPAPSQASTIGFPTRPLWARDRFEARRPPGAEGNCLHQSAPRSDCAQDSAPQPKNIVAQSMPPVDSVKIESQLDILERLAKDLQAISSPAKPPPASDLP